MSHRTVTVSLSYEALFCESGRRDALQSSQPSPWERAEMISTIIIIIYYLLIFILQSQEWLGLIGPQHG